MVKSRFMIDYADGRAVAFATKERATLLVTSEGEFMTPAGVFPLRALGVQGFVMVYDTKQPFDFISVRFGVARDAEGRELPQWGAVLCRKYRDISGTSFDAEVRELFPYFLAFVGLYRAIEDGSAEELLYTLKSFKRSLIEEGVL
jgi:hypothetical protein